MTDENKREATEPEELAELFSEMTEKENNAARYVGAFIAAQATTLCEQAVAAEAGYAQITLPTGLADSSRALIVIVLDALATALRGEADRTGMTLEEAADILGIKLTDDAEDEKGGEQDAD